MNKKIAIIENQTYYLFDTVSCFDLFGDAHKGFLLNFQVLNFRNIKMIKNKKISEFPCLRLRPVRMVLFEKRNPIYYYEF